MERTYWNGHEEGRVITSLDQSLETIQNYLKSLPMVQNQFTTGAKVAISPQNTFRRSVWG